MHYECLPYEVYLLENRMFFSSLIFRRFAAITVIALASLCVFSGVAQAEQAKPNVVVVIADDLTWTDLGCYGGVNVETPRIDSIANAGLRFDSAYTATAMCAPMRMQLYTGLFPVKSGAYPNHSRVYDGVQSVVHYLGDLDYRVGLIGKTHFKPQESFPFEKINGNMAPDGDWSNVAEFIERDEDEPYCLFVCSHEPHLPWNKGDATAFDPDELELTPQILDTPEMRVALCRYYAEIAYLDQQVGEVLDLVDASSDIENTIFMFLSEQGAQIPGAKWTCYTPGLHVGIVMRWPGQIEAGTTSDAMINYVDVVPTLIDAAGGEPIDGLSGRSFLGVIDGETDEHNEYAYGVQTSMGAIGSPPTGYGVRSVQDREFRYVWNLTPEVEYANAVTVGDNEGYWSAWVELAETDEHARFMVDRYISRPGEELYDLEADPYEMNNRATDPAYTEKKAALREKLEAWMEEQGDLGQATELDARSRQGRN